MKTELAKFNALQSEIAKVVAPTLAVVVKDFKSGQQALEATKTVKEMAKRLDDMRREIVDPLNAEVKKINEHVKQIKTPLDQAEAHLRNELNRFAAEQEKIRQEEIRKAEEERKRKEEELRAKQEAEREALEAGTALFGGEETEEVKQQFEEQAAVEQAIATSEYKQKLWDINQFQVKNTRKTVKVRVLDLTKVPREFLIIEVNDKAAIAAHKAGVTIAGLEFYEEISVPIGAKTRVTKDALLTEGK